MAAKLTIAIPEWLDRICTWPVMWYRRKKYGYTFRKIYLGESEWAILDPQDYYSFGNFKWSLGGNGKKFYATRGVKNENGEIKIVRLHRQIIEAPDGLLVDHRNGNGLDNRRTNLRIATQSQNMQNRQKRKNSTSRFIGVWLVKDKDLWESRITYQGKRIWLGRFKSETDAARAYDNAARKYHGEFARLNNV
ncbi:MAG: HNH endonuclease [Sedimentisphaerales bacterium]|nr:HNH endonuclease [Sedimentisphaerales bacterium]